MTRCTWLPNTKQSESMKHCWAASFSHLAHEAGRIAVDIIMEPRDEFDKRNLEVETSVACPKALANQNEPISRTTAYSAIPHIASHSSNITPRFETSDS